MAIDVHGFVAPESNLSGLYKLGDTVQRNQYKKEAEKERKLSQQAADAKFLANYFDPKEHLTGSPLDPQTNILLDKAFTQALELNKQGASTAQVLGAVAPLVNQLNDYMIKGKAFNEQAKLAQQMSGKEVGINTDRLISQMKTMAFPVDQKTGQIDVSKFDPNKNYLDLALREGDVYNEESFDEYMKTAGKNVYRDKLKVTNGKGGFEMKDVEITSPSFMIPDVDESGKFSGFVPEYEIATSNGEPVPHDWDTPEGNKVKAPIRIVTKEVYEGLPNKAKAYLRQEGLKYAKMFGVDATSPEVDNFQRGLAYNNLKGSHKLASSFKQISEQKTTPVKNITNNNINVGGAASGTNINDLYGRISAATQNPDINVAGKPTGTRFNSLDADAQETIIGYVNKGRSADNLIAPEELFLTNENGSVKVYRLNSDGQPIPEGKNLLYTLPKIGSNLKVQPGVKEKREVIIREGAAVENTQKTETVAEKMRRLAKGK